MEGKKNCPYCGAEVSINAKKCKSCGKWIEKRCPYCNEWISADARKCKHCGSWLSEYAKYSYEKKNGISNGGGNLTKDDITKSIKEAEERRKEEEEDRKDEKSTSCLMWIEDVVLLLCIVYAYDWTTAIIVCVITSILLCFQTIRILYCIALSVVWGVVAYSLGGWLWGIILFVLSIAWHAPAFKSKYDG